MRIGFNYGDTDSSANKHARKLIPASSAVLLDAPPGRDRRRRAEEADRLLLADIYAAQWAVWGRIDYEAARRELFLRRKAEGPGVAPC